MPFTQNALDQFFSTYERDSLSDDPAKAAAYFADHFLAAGPQGPMMVPAAAFAQRLPARKQLFNDAGLTSTELTSRRDLRLGDRYVLVETEWTMNFLPENQPSTNLAVSSSFLIDMGSSEPRIVAYIPHQDIFQIMKERRLLPPDEGPGS
jgi:hypothetical protein